jgi:hypothetical protein
MDSKCHHLSKNKNQHILMIQTSLIQLIGELKELSIQLKTKVNVDHAGLFQQQLPLKVNTLLKLEHSFLFLSNNLLTALQHVMDVTEDGNQVPLHMLNFMLKILNLTMYTLLEPNLVKQVNTVEKLILKVTQLFQLNLHPN